MSAIAPEQAQEQARAALEQLVGESNVESVKVVECQSERSEQEQRMGRSFAYFTGGALAVIERAALAVASSYAGMDALEVVGRSIDSLALYFSPVAIGPVSPIPIERKSRCATHGEKCEQRKHYGASGALLRFHAIAWGESAIEREQQRSEWDNESEWDSERWLYSMARKHAIGHAQNIGSGGALAVGAASDLERQQRSPSYSPLVGEHGEALPAASASAAPVFATPPIGIPDRETFHTSLEQRCAAAALTPKQQAAVSAAASASYFSERAAHGLGAYLIAWATPTPSLIDRRSSERQRSPRRIGVSDILAGEYGEQRTSRAAMRKRVGAAVRKLERVPVVDALAPAFHLARRVPESASSRVGTRAIFAGTSAAARAQAPALRHSHSGQCGCESNGTSSEQLAAIAAPPRASMRAALEASASAPAQALEAMRLEQQQSSEQQAARAAHQQQRAAERAAASKRAAAAEQRYHQRSSERMPAPAAPAAAPASESSEQQRYRRWRASMRQRKQQASRASQRAHQRSAASKGYASAAQAWRARASA